MDFFFEPEDVKPDDFIQKYGGVTSMNIEGMKIHFADKNSVDPDQLASSEAS